MSNNNNNKIKKKWTKEREEAVIKKVGKEIEVDKLLKKGEKKPDGTEVTKDEGEKIKVKQNDVQELFKEKTELEIELEKKKIELREKGGYTETYENLALKHDELAKNIKEWEDNLKTGRDYTNQYASFLSSGTGITNPYGTKGWIKLVEDYNKKPLTGKTAPKDKYTNLYEGTLYGQSQKSIKITEQEAVRMITRTIKEFEKIDKGEFKKLITTNIPSGISINRKKLDNASFSNSTEVETWLTTLQNHAKNLVEIEDEHTGRKEYIFGHNFVKDDGTGMVDNEFTNTEMTAFFELVNFLHLNHNLTYHDNFKSKVSKDIPEKTELIFIPAKSEPYTKGQLHAWGVEGYLDKSFKNSKDKTAFYGDVGWNKDTEENERADKAVKFEIEGDIRGWTQLISFFFSLYNGDDLEKTKLIDSFKNNPYPTLLDELRDIDEHGTFTNGGHSYTLNGMIDGGFPKWFYRKKKELYRIQGLRDAELKRLDTGGEELAKAQKAVEDAKQAVRDKEVEIDNKIAERKLFLRTQLKEKYHIDATTYKGFSKTSTEDNRIDINDIHVLIKWLKEIRFLEKGNEEAESSVPNENSAFRDLEALDKKINISISDATTDEEKKIHYVRSGFGIGSSNTPEKFIEYHKKFIENKTWLSYTWQDIIDGFDELEKLVKLPQWYLDIKEAVKKHASKPDTTEKLSDWQSKLKVLNPLITETVFTEDKMKDFQKHNGFKKIDGVVGLIKKVLDKSGTDDAPTYKVKKEFIDNYLTKEEVETNDLGKMFVKFDAEKIIKLIALFDYNQNKSEEEKKKIRRAYSWDQKKKVGDKYVETDGDYSEDNITENEKKLEGEFVKFLYQITTGDKSETSIAQPQSENGDNNDNNNQNQPAKGGIGEHLGKYWHWYLLGMVAIVGAVVTIFWKQISEWWNGPTEEERRAVEENSKEDDEE